VAPEELAELRRTAETPLEGIHQDLFFGPAVVIALLDEIERLQASAEREMESTPWLKEEP
jgi:hypothetical protein